MTDEEISKEYARRISKSCLHITCNQYCSMVYQARIDGLAEGRKELEQWKQEWQDAQIKANEEGFARTTLQIKYTELEKENAELKAEIENLKKTYRKQRNRRIDELQKENAELKEQISVLLSCSNCTENKGGYICEKEYNDKCLSQKIEHIKELQKENEELKELHIQCTKSMSIMAEQIEKMKGCYNCKHQTLKTKDDILFCCECKQLDEQKEKIILTKWECVE